MLDNIDGDTKDDDCDTEFNYDLEILQVYSLVAATADSNVERWKEKFVMLTVMEFLVGRFDNWTKCQILFPCIESILQREPAGDELLWAWVEVFSNAAWYM
ncbi:uncharacterized protein BDZ99DRAFT_526472 [Mytilinidion resinicola]|uniref:Uncharacterized protein n=1 Tax=Mytilinidion resinicola TaxID=574789 RepID=A0A6A6Y6W6_9PEZI|nr:uncharacterized protein BDZ99DRAFT_526472 [Mytilinidion resinicola]KAF2803547.1 hypothetical protein BDZ99DRAFT_526472 [Mytilinidion resinicola]